MKQKAVAMVSSIKHISHNQSQLLQETIITIVKAVNLEMIICYGTRTKMEDSWSCFRQDFISETCTAYDLLVITREKKKPMRDQLRRAISDFNSVEIKFTTIVHSLDAVNDALKEGNHFFSTLYREGVMLYRSKDVSLLTPLIKPVLVSEIKTAWGKSFGLAVRFYEGATNAFFKGGHDLGMFMLHQCVEHVCIALIKVYMGYRPSTHKLNMLLALTENFSPKIRTVVPGLQNGEITSIDMLELSYIDARYKVDYTVDPDTISVLKEQVGKLLRFAEDLYAGKARRNAKNPDRLVHHEVQPFESIGLDTFANVVLQKGETEQVHVESIANEDGIKITVEGSRLWISTGSLPEYIPEMTVYIIYKNLNGLVVNHSGSVTCMEALEVPTLGIIQNGNGSIDLDLDVFLLDATVTKSGCLTLSGFAEAAVLRNHKGGTLDAGKLETSSATVELLGSGSVSIHVEDSLRANLLGAGDIHYKGQPRLKDISVTGTGRIKPLNNHFENTFYGKE